MRKKNSLNKTMRYWHYTTFPALKKILKDEEIKPALKGIEGGEFPAVWFSTNPIWEETARKAVRDKETGEQTEALSRDKLFRAGFPPVRIEVDPQKVLLRSWKNHRKNSGISKIMAKGLEKTARAMGAEPKEWWVTYEPVSLFCCLLPIEVWNGIEWIDIEAVGNND